MELRDLIVTPIVILLVYTVAYLVRSRFCDGRDWQYFIPALSARIVGALAVGFIYQFYYKGGDTFTYHSLASRHIWEAIMADPFQGLQLLGNASGLRDVYEYSSRIYFLRDPPSMMVVKVAAVFDLLTFSSYSATAVLFAVVSFAGSWMLFKTFSFMYPHRHRAIAIATLFVPSVVFWGSGLLKDTLTMAAVGVATYTVHEIFMKEKPSVRLLAGLTIAILTLYAIKVYILMVFAPCAILWIFSYHVGRVRSRVLRLMILPFAVGVAGWLGYLALVKASEENPKYSLNSLAGTAKSTAYDIRYWSGRDAGSGYSLGEMDGSWQKMFSLAPQAINVSLYRPYLWEAKNPLMILSAIESFIMLLLPLYLVVRYPLYFLRSFQDPTVLFCILFSVTFAFAVGVSTYNFGTLVRYKIPMLPFYALALVIIWDYVKRERNRSLLEAHE